MDKTAEAIACKVDHFYVMSKAASTAQSRRDAHNRLVAYVDCYRLVTNEGDNGALPESFDEIVNVCRRISASVYN